MLSVGQGDPEVGFSGSHCSVTGKFRRAGVRYDIMSTGRKGAGKLES